MQKKIFLILLLIGNIIIAQEDKTVTLTVSGTGKTIEEAKTNALRSAIEQAFGAFISSKTEILNDNLVKDEIVSVANGNVQKYDIVSQVEIPNNGYAITLSATVSILKLISFAESKGVEVEFKGGMFAQNIKLQKLNEQSEEKAIKNLNEAFIQLLEISFDYDLTTSEPILVQGQSDIYKINFNVKLLSNKNYNNFIDYFKETLSKVQANEEEVSNILKVGKPIYTLVVDSKEYKFRSINSFHYLDKFFVSTQLLASSFKIYSELGIHKYKFDQLFNNRKFPGFKGDKALLQVYDNTSEKHYLASLFFFFIENDIKYSSLSDLFKIEICPIPQLYARPNNEYASVYNSIADKKRRYMYGYYANYQPINIDGTIYFDTEFQKPSFSYDINLKLSELEKITSFKIEKVPFLEYINNLGNYVNLEK
jgi:hypothetical protein